MYVSFQDKNVCFSSVSKQLEKKESALEMNLEVKTA